jgi:hypothetical protein
VTTGEFHVGWHIKESYRFFQNNWRHFLRLIIVPLTLLVLYNLMISEFYGSGHVPIWVRYFRAIVTASFALVWYRQFLMGTKYATYWQLLAKRFSGNGHFSFINIRRSLLRLALITFSLLIPVFFLTYMAFKYYAYKGWGVNPQILNEVVFHCTVLVMFLFSPVFFRISIYTAGTALGRKAESLTVMWQQTKGYTLLIWLMMLRVFIPLAALSWFLDHALISLVSYLGLGKTAGVLMISIPMGFLTFLILAIVIGATAETFKSLIGVREDKPDRRVSEGFRPRKDRRSTKTSK